MSYCFKYFGRNMYRNAFLLLKNCMLIPRPPAKPPLIIPGYATGLRPPPELEGGGLRQGEDFADKKKEINFLCG